MNIVICDDEKIFCKKLKDLLVEYLKNTGQNFCISIFNDGESLIEQYNQGKSFDIIFLDIKMGKLSGFETANIIRHIDNSVIIIFLTSVFDFVRDGYKLNIFRFLIKAKLEFELDEALSSAITKRQLDMNKKFIFKMGNELICIPLDEIYYFESYRKKIIAYTKNGEYEFYGKISDIEIKLFDNGFVKPYKGYVVNSNFIFSVKDNNLKLNNNKSIPLSKRHIKVVMEAIAYSMEG